LIISLFFTLLYLIRRDTRQQLTWAGIIGSMTWIIMSLVFFVGRAMQGMATYVVGLFFSGIGIILVVLWLIDLLNLGKWARELGEVEV
jgi:hypothetical protein